MNKEFWDEMAKLWCKVFSPSDLLKVAMLANSQVEKEKNSKSAYSLNPLDDEYDEEDDWR